MKIERFEDIEGWQLARELCRSVYELAKNSPLGRDFSLKDQMVRSSGSIMDNIAEGFDGGTNREFIRFLQYSKRSCSELQSQLYRCLDQSYCSQDQFETIYNQTALTRNKIGAFINYLSKHLERRTATN
ncbi:four helix bundle protein [Prosthecobacter fluviatilis]|uniref:Four helix bundle protein n=1 Tax=Prosthecobacter fluviatilis TaxID=445931 RepID=A0ABW0KVG7_9BACT